MKMVRLVLLAYFKRFISFFRPSEDDNVWRDWTKGKKRTMVDVAGVFNGNARDSQKKRSLEILLAPTSHILPYRYLGRIVKEEFFRQEFFKGYHNNYFDCSFLKPLSADLLVYACELVEGYKQLWKEVNGIPAVLRYYNDCALELLALLPPEHKEKAYKLFSLNDIVPWDDFAAESESCSGYNPFFKLLARQDIDEKWKRKAIYDMHAIIVAEATGKKPRVWHEAALRRYVAGLDELFEVPYSKELFAYQVLFITRADNKQIINWQFAEKAFAILDGDAYKSNRLDLAKHVFITNGPLFALSDKDLAFIRRVHDEFGDEKGLAIVLTNLLGIQAAGMARRN